MPDTRIGHSKTKRPKPTFRGQKRPLRPSEVWSIRARLEIKENLRDLALFNLAIDSKLRGCDLIRLKIRLKVNDVCAGGSIRDRCMIVQKKTGRPVQFEITSQTANSLKAWIVKKSLKPADYLFPSRISSRDFLTERHYHHLVDRWIGSIGLDVADYGTHSLRRTKATEIYRKTGNFRAVQLLLGHTKIESTVRYLGVDVEDALKLSASVKM